MMVTRRNGFTLMEIMVASLLVGVVLGLAIKGFGEVQKMTALSADRIKGRNEAAEAVRELAALISRSHIIYFDPRPIDPSAAGGRGVVPPYLFNVGGDPTKVITYYTRGPGGRVANNRQLRDFRVAQAPLLLSVDPDKNVENNFFPSPLAYFAEANFPTVTPDTVAAGTATGYTRHTAANIPVSWNFHLLYLVPRDTRSVSDSLLPVEVAANTSLGQRDQAERRGPAGNLIGRWSRTPSPLQLRLLTIRNVSAHINDALYGDPANPNANSNVPARPWGRRTNAERNGIAATDPDINLLLPAPYDYPVNQVSYDPIPLAGGAGAAASLTQSDPTLAAAQGQAASGRRVAGINPHANFANIGNDPPSQAVFVDNPSAVDRLIADYIDPDNVDGTGVRLVAPAPGTVPYAINANVYTDNDTPAFNFFSGIENAAVPRRAVLSVTTRYRSTRQIPFQFHTETIEVDLESLVRYQSINRTKL